MNHLKSSLLAAALALVTLTSANAQIYINEIYFNPAGTDAPNEYIELRGTPSLSISTGTYLLFLEGDNSTTTTAGVRAGDIQGIFDLSGKAFGSNGYMVLRQNGSPYSVNSSATSYTATSTGWGGLGFNTSATVAGDVENLSFTAMVISIGTAAAPTRGQQLDAKDSADCLHAMGLDYDHRCRTNDIRLNYQSNIQGVCHMQYTLLHRHLPRYARQSYIPHNNIHQSARFLLSTAV